MDKCSKTAALYIATLRAMTIVHTQSHWLSKGNDFYGDHLLFERIYNSALEDLDLAAEKCVGLFGEDCLDFSLQNDLLHKVLSNYTKMKDSPFEEVSLAVEKDFLKLSQSAYDCFEEEGKLTLGLDDTIMSIASKREEACYLLQQALKGHHKEGRKGLMERLQTYAEPDVRTHPVIQYLISSIPAAAANAGINNVVVQVDINRNPDPNKETYKAIVSGIDAKHAPAFEKAWNKQLELQRPDLLNRVVIEYR